MEVQFCLLGDRPFGDDLPVELDRVIHHAGQIADDNVQIRNTFGVRLLSVFRKAIFNNDSVTDSSCMAIYCILLCFASSCTAGRRQCNCDTCTCVSIPVGLPSYRKALLQNASGIHPIPDQLNGPGYKLCGLFQSCRENRKR